MNEETGTTNRRFSSMVIIVIIVVLAISLTAIYQGVEMFQSDDPELQAQTGFYVLIGFIGLALSSYMLLQTRRRVRKFTLKMQPVTTTIVCSKCGFKNIRDFERGDYILKEMGPCVKCEGTLVTSAIYREVKDKGKEEKTFT